MRRWSTPRFAPRGRLLARCASLAWIVATLSASPAPLAAADRAGEINGLPFARVYSFDEIGDVSRGANISFDRNGRIIVVQDGAILVLNDNVWLDLGPKDPDTVRIQRIVRDSDGTNYYGARGSCGVLRRSEKGTITPETLLPAECPNWVSITSFDHFLCRPEGIYFCGFNGVVFWNRITRRTTFFEVPECATIFALGNRVFVSSHLRGVQVLDPIDGTLRGVDRRAFENSVIDNVANTAGGRAVVSTSGNRLFVCDGTSLRPLGGPLGGVRETRVTTLLSLPDGNVAAAITGQGLFIISPDGEIIRALTNPEYRRINTMATNEPGVLWAVTENGVAKILYGIPVTWIGQALGLPVDWPQVVRWQDRVIIASNGRIFEAVPTGPAEPAQFRPLERQPAAGGWGIATWGKWLLVGDSAGVFATSEPGRGFQPVLEHFDVARLSVLASGVCFAVGATDIAALKYDDGAWHECAPRARGIGFPSMIHAAKNSAWIELGASRVARVWLQDGRIQTRIFNSFPWTDNYWTNVSILDDTVVLSGPPNGRMFFDEKTQQFVTHPSVEAVLAHAPFWPLRIQPADDGRWWISHDHGLFTLTPTPGGCDVDTTTYRIISDHVPFVQALPGSDIWASRGGSLYHISPRPGESSPSAIRPVLVSAHDLRTGLDLLDDQQALSRGLAYRENSIGFRFFAGTYAFKRAVAYEYRVNRDAWTPLEPTSLLRLSNLREGPYHIDVRLVDESGPVGATRSFDFAVVPPWYRTWYAYAGYALLAAVLLSGLMRLSVYRARARNAVLEKMVTDRTEELNATMQKLEQETRTAATLAERNRLAGEIHDSLEQGFSALMLQLETTSGLADCPAQVKGALSVAKNMVAFSRNEVRHAVQNLHSPMLEAGGLETALKSMISQAGPDAVQATVVVEGHQRMLRSTVEHHLLRIAQEAIANAVKHAAATRIDVRLAFTAAEVQLRVADDGRGFDSATVLAGPIGHFGLRSLRGRARKIGAALEILSHPGSGTSVTVRVPFDVEPNN